MARWSRSSWARSDDISLLLRATMNGRRRRRDDGSIVAWAKLNNRTANACYQRLHKLRADPALRPPEMTGATSAPRAEAHPQAPAACGPAEQ